MQYLSIPPTTAVAKANVNIRQGPGMEHAIIATLRGGVTVALLPAKIRTDDRIWQQVVIEGWVASEYLES